MEYLTRIDNMVEVEEISFSGWDKCIKIANGTIELVATLEVGPRIIRFGFSNQDNEFAVDNGQLESVGGEEWNVYGGHRLWHAPEHEERSYLPDNDPVDYEKTEKGVRLIQPTQEKSKIQKEMEIEIDPTEPKVEVLHRLINRGLWEIELAPWALSVMSSGGKAIVPFSRGNPDSLLPDRSITLWPYTKLEDERLQLKNEFIFLNQNEKIEDPIKIGAMVKDGWIAYWNRHHLFVKRFEFDEDGNYPDVGCSVESYTNDFMLEFETLGPLEKMDPGDAVEHSESWELFDDVPEPNDSEDVRDHILPLID